MVTIASILINNFFIGKYYIHEKRKILDKVENEISSSYVIKVDEIQSIEEDNNVTIAYSSLDRDIEDINGNILSQFESKGIKLNKFWVTKDTLDQLSEGSINKIYYQGKVKYKFLSKFILHNDYVFAIGISLPYLDETVNMVNKFNTYLMIFLLIITIILAIIFSKHITRPLEKLKLLSKDIANLNFRTEKIETNDEIGELATSINSMSVSLEKAHKDINSQNERLKALVSDISHELKTPLSLINVYAQGIEDGLDDGTYLETIKKQTENMSMLIDRLLYWAKLQKKPINKSKFSLKDSVVDIIKKYKLIIEENNIELILNVKEKEKYYIYADEEQIDIVLNNLVTNAIKYTNNKKIEISLIKSKDDIKITIKNGIRNHSSNDIESIWKPFYVLEKSRNKDLSGTGLGLSIVKDILENHNLKFGFETSDGSIEFYIIF
ncbi:HAMP domain-containing sensor histidine kinase [Clostridium sp. CTA-19]